MSHSVDFRRKVLGIREQEGLSIIETAKRFHIGTDSLTRWLRRIEPQQSGPRQCKLDKVELAKDVVLYPDAYQRERAACFQVCYKVIWQSLNLKADEETRHAFQDMVACYKSRENRSFIWMKAVSHMICHEPTVMLHEVNAVGVSRIGRLRAEHVETNLASWRLLHCIWHDKMAESALF